MQKSAVSAQKQADDLKDKFERDEKELQALRSRAAKSSTRSNINFLRSWMLSRKKKSKIRTILLH